MKSNGNKYAGSVPQTYHDYLVPILFDPYARDLAQRLTVSGNASVLEMAAGTGVLTEWVWQRLSPSAELVVTDINPAMLAVAEQNLPTSPNIYFQVASGTALPFERSHFDIVLCQFGVMFFPDVELGYREAFRVLKPGGRLLFNVWGSLQNNDFSRVVHEAVIALDKENPPDFIQSPYQYCDQSLIRRQLERTGFTDISAETVKLESLAESARDLALALAAGSPLAMQLSERGLMEFAIDSIESSLHEKLGAGELRAPMEAIIFEAMKPK